MRSAIPYTETMMHSMGSMWGWIMETQHYVARAKLRRLEQQHPEWTHTQMAAATGYSIGWVRKWRARLRAAPPDDDAVLWGQSRARKTSVTKRAPAVVARILEIRDTPPGNLRRTPGPKTILYYLHKDAALKASGADLPQSPTTIWRVLDEHHRIVRPAPVDRQPRDPAFPLQHWGIDFKDISSILPDPEGEGKRQHVVETFNVVYHGTSMLLTTDVRADFNEETALEAMAQALRDNGVPVQVTCDRDPRFVGSYSGRDFPSPFMRFLMCLGVEVDVCPPRRPDLNPYVERFHGTYNRECLQVHRPGDLDQACEVTIAFASHYNLERPNQAITCGNQPPCEAFPDLPPLPPVPTMVDPDAWLHHVHGARYARKVRADGTITVDNLRYYVKQKLRGERVALVVDAFTQEFLVLHHKHIIKTMPIKGLYHGVLPFEDYLHMMCKEAVSQRRRGRRRAA